VREPDRVTHLVSDDILDHRPDNRVRERELLCPRIQRRGLHEVPVAPKRLHVVVHVHLGLQDLPVRGSFVLPPVALRVVEGRQ
jgi:hypothetical protein